MSLPDLGLIGRKRTGKSTAASYLEEVYGYAPLAFADPLRDCVAALNPIVAHGTGHRYREVVDALGYETAKDAYPEVRRVLQEYGTGVRRLDPEFWVAALMRRVEDVPDDVPVVVTDVRFANEAAALREDGFALVKLTRPAAADGDSHPSEADLDEYAGHYDYDNSGSVDDLYRFLDVVVRDR